MGETGAVAVPLIGDAAGKVLEDAELEVDAGVEGAVRPSQQPSFPVRVALANGGDVFVLRNVPARTVVVPSLTDRHDLAQLAASDDVPYALLIRATQPLRSHLRDLFACEYGFAGEPGVLQRVRHRLLAIAVLPGSHDLGQDSRVLVIPGTDHHGVQAGIREHLFGVLIRLRTLAEQPLRVVRRSFAIQRPQIADTAQIEIWIRLG